MDDDRIWDHNAPGNDNTENTALYRNRENFASPYAHYQFQQRTSAIQEDTLRLLFHVKVEQKVEREQVAKVTGTNKDESAAKAPKKREHAKVYPNDPCPCGSGKKYKQCCGRKVV